MSFCGTEPGGPQEKPEGSAQEKHRAVWLVRKPSHMDDVLFLIGLILLAAGLALVLLQAFVPEEAQRLHWPFPCAFYSVLHIPCLGCGATRAVRALAGGRLWTSFLYHPGVLCFAVLGTAFLLSQTAGRISRGRLRMLTFNDAYIYAILAVLLLQWIIKLITGWTP